MRRFDEVHPPLTVERIRIVARTILQARRSAAEVRSQYEDCDINFGIGCLSFDLTRDLLTKLAAVHPWINVVKPELDFTFAIEGVMLRYFRGSPDAPPTRHRDDLVSARIATQTAFGFVDDDDRLEWRFVVEEPEIGGAVRVHLVAYAGSVARHTWFIEDETASPGLVDVTSHLPAIAEVQDVEVRLRAPGEISDQPNVINLPLEESDGSA